jgi:hypothetical protein
MKQYHKTVRLREVLKPMLIVPRSSAFSPGLQPLRRPSDVRVEDPAAMAAELQPPAPRFTGLSWNPKQWFGKNKPEESQKAAPQEKSEKPPSAAEPASTKNRTIRTLLPDGTEVIEFDADHVETLLEKLVRDPEKRAGILGDSFYWLGAVFEDDAGNECWINIDGGITRKPKDKPPQTPEP